MTRYSIIPILFILCFVSMILVSCSLFESGPEGVPKKKKTDCKTVHKQGVRGQVLYFAGNFMPDSEGQSNLKGKPVKRKIGVFAPTKPEQTKTDGSMTFYEDIKTRCVQFIETDKTGCFSINLPEGKYSFLVWEEGKWFSNLFDEENVLTPVVVEKGKVTNVEIQINHKAVY